MIQRTWHSLDDRVLLQVIVAGTSGDDIQTQSKTAMNRALSEMEKAGFTADHVVRSRVWGRDAATRTAASDIRRLEYADHKRGATASFYDSERLPDGADMMIDVFALKTRKSAARKVFQEYDTPATAPLFVELDGMVLLSGNTDTSPKFEDQLVKIRGKIELGLQRSGTQWKHVSLVSAFVSKTVDAMHARKAIAEAFPEMSCPLVLTSVDGFSSPGKLIEIEVNALRT
jgi:enamine deaminase RidA (YjgF/YER057c/UK114 family)